MNCLHELFQRGMLLMWSIFHSLQLCPHWLSNIDINLYLSTMAWERECSFIIALGLWNIDMRFFQWHAFNMMQYSFDIVIYISYSTWKGGFAWVNLHISSTLNVKTKTTITRKQAGHWQYKGRKYQIQRNLRKSPSLDRSINVATNEDYASLHMYTCNRGIRVQYIGRYDVWNWGISKGHGRRDDILLDSRRARPSSSK